MNDQREPSADELRRVVPQDRGGRELWVGLFVIVGLISFVVVLFLTTDPATMRDRYMVVTTMTDAGGVRRGDPIQMRGVNIGRVNRFEMTPDGRVHIRMEIEGDWEIPEGSIARLGEAGMFGGRTMLIDPGTSSTPVEPFDTIPGEGERSSLMESIGEVGDDAEVLLGQLISLFDDPTIGSLRSSAGELPSVLREIRDMAETQRNQLADLTASLNRSAQGLEEFAGASPEAASAISRADSAMGQLNSTLENLDGAIDSLDRILARIDESDGTLARLIDDSALYDNAASAAASLDLLLIDIRENPRKFLPPISIF